MIKRDTYSLEVWEAGFGSGFYVLFDHLADYLSIIVAQEHAFFVADCAAHVPTHLEYLAAYGFCLCFKLLDQFFYFVKL